MFKVLCQFRVLDEHKKNGGHFEPVRSSLPHKEHSFWIRGRPLLCDFKHTTTARFYLLNKNDFDPTNEKSEIYTRATHVKERKRFLFFYRKRDR